eukprot:444105-Lingulodinium_polyedra.AAC.1
MLHRFALRMAAFGMFARVVLCSAKHEAKGTATNQKQQTQPPRGAVLKHAGHISIVTNAIGNDRGQP